MAETKKGLPEHLPRVPEGGGEYSISHNRYLTGVFDEAGKFHFQEGGPEHLVVATVDFPQVVVLPEGQKLDRGLKPLGPAGKPEVPVLKKPWSSAPQPQGKVPSSAEFAKKGGKRPSDESPI